MQWATIALARASPKCCCSISLAARDYGQSLVGLRRASQTFLNRVDIPTARMTGAGSSGSRSLTWTPHVMLLPLNEGQEQRQRAIIMEEREQFFATTRQQQSDVRRSLDERNREEAKAVIPRKERRGWGRMRGGVGEKRRRFEKRVREALPEATRYQDQRRERRRSCIFLLLLCSCLSSCCLIRSGISS